MGSTSHRGAETGSIKRSSKTLQKQVNIKKTPARIVKKQRALKEVNLAKLETMTIVLTLMAVAIAVAAALLKRAT